MTRLEGQASMFRTQAEATKKRLEKARPDPKEVERLEKAVAKLSKDYEKIDKKAKALKTEVDELHEKIMDIGGAKLSVVQNKLKKINSSSTEVGCTLQFDRWPTSIQS